MIKNKRGLSGVVVAVIMIALVMAAAAIIWVVVSNMIQGKTKNAENCFGNYDKIKINGIYTCHDSDNNEAQFSISIGDIEIESLLISIYSAGSTSTFELTNIDKLLPNLQNYPRDAGGFGTENVKLPSKNGGLTYIADNFLYVIDKIEISPTIGGSQCGIADTSSVIDDCDALA